MLNFPYEQTTKFVPVTGPARLPSSYEEALSNRSSLKDSLPAQKKGNGKRGMENEEWKTRNGKRGMENEDATHLTQHVKSKNYALRTNNIGY